MAAELVAQLICLTYKLDIKFKDSVFVVSTHFNYGHEVFSVF